MRLALILAACVSLAVPAISSAQNGVTYDPDSPAGKQYALPTDAARRDTAPKTAGSSQSNAQDSTAPLFGSGIKAETAAATPSGDSGSTSSHAGNSASTGRRKNSHTANGAKHSAEARDAAGSSAAPQPQLKVVLSSQEGVGTGGAILLIAVIGGVACFGAGSLIRRRVGSAR